MRCCAGHRDSFRAPCADVAGRHGLARCPCRASKTIILCLSCCSHSRRTRPVSEPPHIQTASQTEAAAAQAIVTVVENQALVWLGAMYSPLMPIFGLVSNVIMFYTKLLLALVAYEPPHERYSVSRTSVMAYTLMLGASPCLRTMAWNHVLFLGRNWLPCSRACLCYPPCFTSFTNFFNLIYFKKIKIFIMNDRQHDARRAFASLSLPCVLYISTGNNSG